MKKEKKRIIKSAARDAGFTGKAREKMMSNRIFVRGWRGYMCLAKKSEQLKWFEFVINEAKRENIMILSPPEKLRDCLVHLGAMAVSYIAGCSDI